MANIKFKGSPIHTVGDLPRVGSVTPDFALVKTDLSEAKLADFKGKKVVLNIFPSVDTGVCAASVRRFNKEASECKDVTVLCISRDLPFAQARFCGAEGLDKVVTLSTMRGAAFLQDYGVAFATGPLVGLTARAVIVLDEQDKVLHSELVPEVAQEPDYAAALAALV